MSGPQTGNQIIFAGSAHLRRRTYLTAVRFFSTIHILLFAYVVAALVFWGLSLQKQSRTIYALEVDALRAEIDSAAQPAEFARRKVALDARKRSRRSQYIGEGATFMLVIIVGAAVVYSSYRRRLRLSRQQNNFMLAVTHELKSPLAAMKLSLQTMEKHPSLQPAQRADLIHRCVAEGNRLNELCNNMLLASQIEGRQHKPAREELDFSALTDDVVDDYAARYPQRFTEEIAPGLRAVGDRLMLHMAVANLLENAVKYTPPGSPIEVVLQARGDCAVLTVADRGAGIPDAEKRKIFEKFYRVGDEATRRAKGTGLGLYLTRKIVRQHRGKICARDNRGGGTVMEITLPRAGE